MNKSIPFIIALALLSGCSSMLNTAGTGEFSCPGMPGVICKTPGEVYRMTEGDTMDPSALSPPKPPARLAGHVSMPTDTHTPAPIREPAKVMRVWIAPWADKNDDLHWPSYVYTEIEARKWSFGNQDFKSMNPVIPYKNFAATSAQPSAASKTKQAAPSGAAFPSPSENP